MNKDDKGYIYKALENKQKKSRLLRITKVIKYHITIKDLINNVNLKLQIQFRLFLDVYLNRMYANKYL